ncbi:hypothetical protein Drorol1_Dr00019417 [Drosera rotundifolia]
MAETLNPNDDLLERAQARAARAAANRRRSLSINAAHLPSASDSDQCLSKDQVLELFNNCIKLASENKINQKNTWDLNLIDHLCDIVKVEEEEDVETNFQKASCTLEAGVKIYSLRVDNVHSEAYKVLGGINRAGHEEEKDNSVENPDKVDQEEGSSKEFKKMTPTSTLESSFEALNLKKFDAAFAVDPLYHQTSAQFDEGGAKGLLLNNLGVYGGCRVLFDSCEVPGKCLAAATEPEKDELVDLTFAKECIEQMVLNMQKVNEISPTLGIIVSQFDEDNKRPEVNQFADYNKISQISAEQAEATSHDEADFSENAYDDCGPLNIDHNDGFSIACEAADGADASFPVNYEENEPFGPQVPDIDDRFEKVDDCLFLSLGFASKQNSWAGPDHWKYQKAKGPEEVEPEPGNGSPVTTKKTKTRKKAEVDIDFTTALNTNFSDIFLPPKNPKSLLLPANRAPCNTKLPEDCHYQPENLVKLFLLPNILCLGKRQSKASEMGMEQNVDYGDVPPWEDECAFDGPCDDGYGNSDEEASSKLVSQPRQVNKIEIQYDKTSKQVDVQTLKEVLWEQMTHSCPAPSQKGEEEAVSFRNVLASFPSDCTAAATVEQISPHICFICLLHLANEHGLRLHGSATLDDLSIDLHTSSESISAK